MIREYFGTGERPRCPHCGGKLDMTGALDRADRWTLRVACATCQVSFQWRQLRPEQPWNDLHKAYFVERYRKGDRLRCPYDDCSVGCLEFNERVIEFRCPCCNRRGRVQLPEASPSDRPTRS